MHRKSKIGAPSRREKGSKSAKREMQEYTYTRSSNVDNKICNENQRRAASAYVIAIFVVVVVVIVWHRENSKRNKMSIIYSGNGFDLSKEYERI